jgi:hypothetical protein
MTTVFSGIHSQNAAEAGSKISKAKDHPQTILPGVFDGRNLSINASFR